MTREGPKARPKRRRLAPDERPPGALGNVAAGRAGRSSPASSRWSIGIVGEHPTAIGIGVALAGLGGLEVAIREHFAGYRSHTTLLAGAAFVLTVGGALLPRRPDPRGRLAIGAVAFAIVFYLARRAFQRASGGLSYRVGGNARLSA